MKEEPKCDHKGKWKPLGLTGTSQFAQEYKPDFGFVTAFRAAIYCEACGVIKAERV